MKQQILMIHGGDSFAEYELFLELLRTKPIPDPLGLEKSKGWKDTLSERLGEEYEVYYPKMPNKENARYKEWKIWFERYVEFLRESVVLIGHSQGACFLAKYLSENKMPVSVRALYLVAGPFESGSYTGADDGGDFGFDPSKLTGLKEQVDEICIFHSKDDPVVPFSQALRYKEALPEAELVAFEDKNHFLLEEFPELVETIKKLTSN